jgi:hypothetical protein
MNRERNQWLVIGMVLTMLASVGLGVLTVSGFASAPAGDMAVSSVPATTNLLAIFAAVALIGLEVAYTHRQPGRSRRMASVPKATRV